MRRFLKTLGYYLAAFYAGCLVPFAIVSVAALLLPGIPSWATNVILVVAIVAGLWAMPLTFNWLDRRWPRSRAESCPRREGVSVLSGVRKARSSGASARCPISKGR